MSIPNSGELWVTNGRVQILPGVGVFYVEPNTIFLVLGVRRNFVAATKEYIEYYQVLYNEKIHYILKFWFDKNYLSILQ